MSTSVLATITSLLGVPEDRELLVCTPFFGEQKVHHKLSSTPKTGMPLWLAVDQYVTVGVFYKGQWYDSLHFAAKDEELKRKVCDLWGEGNAQWIPFPVGLNLPPAPDHLRKEHWPSL